MIKAIIFDFGKVLANFNHARAFEALAEHSHLTAEEIRVALSSGDNAPTKRHESGELRAHDFFLEARRVAHLNGGVSFKEFCEIWENIFTENVGIEIVLSRIRPEIRQCALSNTDPIHWHAIEKLPVMRQFFHSPNLYVRSYDVRACKPDIRMYNAALSCLGLGIEDVSSILFIEDVPEYRKAFERMGGNALAYDCSRDPISQLEAGLRKFGVF